MPAEAAGQGPRGWVGSPFALSGMVPRPLVPSHTGGPFNQHLALMAVPPLLGVNACVRRIRLRGPPHHCACSTLPLRASSPGPGRSARFGPRLRGARARRRGAAAAPAPCSATRIRAPHEAGASRTGRVATVNPKT